jgi:hypothetical protein
VKRNSKATLAEAWALEDKFTALAGSATGAVDRRSATGALRWHSAVEKNKSGPADIEIGSPIKICDLYVPGSMGPDARRALLRSLKGEGGEFLDANVMVAAGDDSHLWALPVSLKIDPDGNVRIAKVRSGPRKKFVEIGRTDAKVVELILRTKSRGKTAALKGLASSRKKVLKHTES